MFRGPQKLYRYIWISLQAMCYHLKRKLSGNGTIRMCATYDNFGAWTAIIAASKTQVHVKKIKIVYLSTRQLHKIISRINFLTITPPGTKVPDTISRRNSVNNCITDIHFSLLSTVFFISINISLLHLTCRLYKKTHFNHFSIICTRYANYCFEISNHLMNVT